MPSSSVGTESIAEAWVLFQADAVDHLPGVWQRTVALYVALCDFMLSDTLQPPVAFSRAVHKQPVPCIDIRLVHF
eukprot:8164-Heterococcus_DN1.PRE.7